jgi:two-component system CheB/CheR fusion protein
MMLHKRKNFGLDVSGASKQVGKKLSADPMTNLVPAQANAAEVLKSAPDSKRAAFAIVAIGASAGGLEAFTQLLPALPATTGMAFVLLQHLDPKHHSLLPELLAKNTTMPVAEAKHGTKVSPDHIYVIPPNVNLAIASGTLQLTPRSDAQGRHLPIDFFMRSLAEEQKSRAIGVVLSGTASDGTLGLQAIKAEGGITFAQEEKSAQYDAMPRSAIASGAVDFVLPPEEIAKELSRIGRHPYVSRARPQPGIPTPQQGATHRDQVFGLLRNATGADFSQYKPATIERRIWRRMAIHKMDSMAAYVKYLQGHPTEVADLYKDLLIPVTSFFRDAAAFQALKSKVFPAIAKNRAATAAIRMWTPGCSTGEETYSLLIALLEFLGSKATSIPIQIFGTDLSERGIETARAGLYPESIARNVSPERLRRFFIREENGYRISKTLRDRCVFARQNLFSDPPFSQMDLVSCRNVLIYMEPVLQKRVLPLLHYALKPTGFLLLGASEGTAGSPSLFAAVDKKHRIYSKKPAPTRLHFDFVSGRFPAEPATAPGTAPARRRENEAGFDVQKEADRIVLSNHAPAGVIVDSNLEVVQFRGRTRPYLEPAPGRASLNLLKMARGELGVHLHNAINQAKKKGAPVRRQGIRLQRSAQSKEVSFEVVPLNAAAAKEPSFLILFQEVPPPAHPEPQKAAGGKRAGVQQREIGRLWKELAASKETLRAVIEESEATKEEFQAANEEVVSANEELQSTNEELETSKEELQSANEELNTVNEEMRSRNTELHQLNNDLYNLFRAIDVPVVMLARDLCIRRVTPAAEKVLKIIPSDVNRPITDIRLGLQLPNLEQLVSEAIDTAVVRERELTDREGRWYSLKVHPYRTMDDVIDGAVLALFDIDALKRASEHLRIAKEFAERIIDTVRQPLLVLDSTLRVIRANSSFFTMFQLSHDDTDGKFIYQLGGNTWKLPELRRLLEEVVAKDTSFSDFEVEREFPKIGRRTMLLNSYRLQHAVDGDPAIFLAITDISERRVSEAARIAYEKLAASGRMAAMLAHEINNPLSSVTNALYLLSRHESLDETARGYTKAADQELRRIAHISRSTLALFRESGSPVRTKVVDVVESALALFAPQIEARKVVVQKDYRSEGTIQAFPGEIRQMLANLIDNALEVVTKGKIIKLRVVDSGDWSKPKQRGVRILIADNGPGIPPELRSAVFEPFFTTKGKKGAGLGLWVTQGIVHKYQGSIRFRSSIRPGRSGTCFSLFLPTRLERTV